MAWRLPTRSLQLRYPEPRKEALGKDQAHDLCSLGAHSHAESDLRGAQNHGIREHSINAAERQLQGNKRKECRQYRDKAALGPRTLNHGREWLEMGDGYIAMEAGDLLTYEGREIG